MTSLHGQDAEYAIPKLLHGILGGGCAIDVGAERGGFTAACSDSGWARIVAFEPLPRHAESLRSRFTGMEQISIHQIALSGSDGESALKIAVDPTGKELDYHHTLADMADTDSVHFTRQERVRTMTPATAIRSGLIPARPDLVKLDTEGHDLAIIRAFGPLRPRVLICEYWCDLPKTSGKCPYSLTELAGACRALALTNLVTFRHRDGLSWIERDSTSEIPGDWGNAVFVTDEAWAAGAGGVLSDLAAASIRSLVRQLEATRNQLQEKEAVIHGLAEAAQNRLALIETLDAALRASRERSQAEHPGNR